MESTQLTAPVQAADHKISFEEFLRRYDGQRAEWLDGEVSLMSPVSFVHTQLVTFLTLLLRTFVELKQLGAVLGEPFTMHLPNYGPEPDIYFVVTERLKNIQPNRFEGAADLVIEVISPDSDKRDRVQKFNAYEAAGVHEYWVLDPIFKEALFYQLGEDKAFHRVPPNEQGAYHSAVVIGFRITVALLWADPLPGVIQTVELARKMLADKPSQSTDQI